MLFFILALFLSAMYFMFLVAWGIFYLILLIILCLREKINLKKEKDNENTVN